MNLFTVQQTAEQLAISQSLLYREVSRGEDPLLSSGTELRSGSRKSRLWSICKVASWK